MSDAPTAAGTFLDLGSTDMKEITIAAQSSPVLLNLYVKDGKLHADYDPAKLTEAANALMEEVIAKSHSLPL